MRDRGDSRYMFLKSIRPFNAPTGSNSHDKLKLPPLTFFSSTNEQLSFANSWVQYGVLTNRAILSYGWPYNVLGPGTNWPQSSLDVFLQEGAIRGNKSLCVLERRLAEAMWLAVDRPTIADLSAFLYVALAPMVALAVSRGESVD